jgi:hypothetical protein
MELSPPSSFVAVAGPAPRDGRTIRVLSPWLPPEGERVRWGTDPEGFPGCDGGWLVVEGRNKGHMLVGGFTGWAEDLPRP